jgi:hypothetical protein
MRHRHRQATRHSINHTVVATACDCDLSAGDKLHEGGMSRLTCLLEEGAVRMELQRRGMSTLANFFSASRGLCAAASRT